MVWNEKQFGQWKAGDIKRVRSDNKYLRYYLIEADNLVRMHEREYADFYSAKYDKAHTHINIKEFSF